MKNDKYLKEKVILDKKYNKQISILVKETEQAVEDKSCEIFGETYCELKKEIEILKTEIDNHRFAFYESKEYTETQNRLSDIQEKIKKCTNENEKAFLQNDLNEEIKKMQTLNIKCENQLKTKTDNLSHCEKDVAAIIEKKRDLLEAYKKQVFLLAKDKLNSIITEYNEELNVLKAKHLIQLSTEKEVPAYNSDTITIV